MQIDYLSDVITEGAALAAEGQFGAAIALYRQTLHTWPGWLDGYHLLAKLLIEQEALPEAIALYQQAIQVLPEQASLYVNLATLRSIQHNSAAAVRAYEQAIALDPSWPRSYLRLAWLYEGLAQPEDAIATYDRGLKACPAVGELWRFRSRCLEQQGQWAAAIEGYLQWLAIDPEAEGAYRAIERLGVHHQRPDWFDIHAQHDLTPTLLDRFSQIIGCESQLIWATGSRANSAGEGEETSPFNPRLDYFLQLRDAIVWVESQTVAILNCETKFLAEASSGKLSTLLRKKSTPTRPQIKPGKALILSTFWGENYYHWVFDVLPRIGKYQAHFPQGEYALDYIDYVVCDKISHPFHRESLGVLGIETHKVIETGSEAVLGFELVLVPPYMNGITRYACNFLRNTFLAQVVQGQELGGRQDAYPTGGGLEKIGGRQDAYPTGKLLSGGTGSLLVSALEVSKPAKKIYITRRKSSYRRLLNEAEVMEFLVGAGFAIVELEALPLLAQVAVFASAAVVVAPHGAGLTNLVFASPGTWVLELQSIAYRPTCYQVISEFVGLNYCAVIGEAVQPEEALFQGEPAWYDLRVDLEEIKTTLATFGPPAQWV